MSLATCATAVTGSREGTLYWSREKLTNNLNVEAERRFREGDTKGALNKIERSLALNHAQPGMVVLREQINGQRTPVAGRSFLEHVINNEATRMHVNAPIDMFSPSAPAQSQSWNQNATNNQQVATQPEMLPEVAEPSQDQQMTTETNEPVSFNNNMQSWDNTQPVASADEVVDSNGNIVTNYAPAAPQMTADASQAPQGSPLPQLVRNNDGGVTISFIAPRPGRYTIQAAAKPGREGDAAVRAQVIAPEYGRMVLHNDSRDLDYGLPGDPSPRPTATPLPAPPRSPPAAGFPSPGDPDGGTPGVAAR